MLQYCTDEMDFIKIQNFNDNTILEIHNINAFEMNYILIVNNMQHYKNKLFSSIKSD